MPSSPRDNNRIPAILGTLDTDGKTPINIKVNASTFALKVSDGTTGSSLLFVNSQKDDNRVSAWWGVSNADGKTLIPIYANSNGELLIKST